jgi:hypothetical protein
LGRLQRHPVTQFYSAVDSSPIRQVMLRLSGSDVLYDDTQLLIDIDLCASLGARDGSQKPRDEKGTR